MATILPRSFALKSNKNQKYLRYIHQRMENLDGLIQPCEEDFKSECAKFQMEPAGSGHGGLVHIKCCFNNKYLRRANEHQSFPIWLVAGANEPEEDKNQWSCTLFEPVVVQSDKKAVIRLIHVQLGYSVMPFRGFECIVAWYPEPFPGNVIDVFTVVDLEPLPLPSPFALKSKNNDSHLRHMLDQENDIHEILRFSAPDCTSDFAQFQVERANSRDHQNNQYVHIKCLFNNKYLRRMDVNSKLIVPAADVRDEITDRWYCTLFKPVRVGTTGNNHTQMSCRLLHVQSDLYTKPNVDNKSELHLGQKNPDPQGADVYIAIGTHT